MQIYRLKKRAKRAAWVAAWIGENSNNWWELSLDDQALWEEHESGSIRRQIAELRELQQPRFVGFASSIADKMQC